MTEGRFSFHQLLLKVVDHLTEHPEKKRIDVSSTQFEICAYWVGPVLRIDLKPMTASA